MPVIVIIKKSNNGHADPDEIRLYDSGDGYEVECGSCHDPHGIKVNVVNQNEIIPSFLRVGSFIGTGAIDGAGLTNNISANSGSSLCLTCHVK